ncbi:MAG: hypothetical protein OET18_17315 [Desulfobacterales bacterium]|nr:hypothetical protein [Desulfobacterales bacterium]|tara:strand:+ start:175 stop:396 length:222 start_codon:yes stop_codon:yes gene_type:complete
MAAINTTGDLRKFLCSSITSVANGTMDISKAREVTKLAGQVNESFYSEVKVARLQIDLKEESDKLGSLPVAGK